MLRLKLNPKPGAYNDENEGAISVKIGKNGDERLKNASLLVDRTNRSLLSSKSVNLNKGEEETARLHRNGSARREKSKESKVMRQKVSSLVQEELQTDPFSPIKSVRQSTRRWQQQKQGPTAECYDEPEYSPPGTEQVCSIGITPRSHWGSLNFLDLLDEKESFGQLYSVYEANGKMCYNNSCSEIDWQGLRQEFNPLPVSTQKVLAVDEDNSSSSVPFNNLELAVKF